MADEETGGVSSQIDLYDSDILKIEEVVLWLNNQIVGTRKKIDDLDKEIVERFAQRNFRVSVQWWTSNVEGTYIPEVTIHSRIKDEEFDHDRMVHEVTNDILDLGTGGVIKTSGSSLEAIAERVAAEHKGHKH